MQIVRLAFVACAASLLAEGQIARPTTLAVQVRPECGILSSVVDANASEAVLRFRYSMRTGPAGGMLQVALPLGTAPARFQVSLSGPAIAKPHFTLHGGESIAAAVLPPHRFTARLGEAGEIRWSWLTPQPSPVIPSIFMSCR
jgi:hypothetical protein